MDFRSYQIATVTGLTAMPVLFSMVLGGLGSSGVVTVLVFFYLSSQSRSVSSVISMQRSVKKCVI